MKRISRPHLIGALVLILISSGCNLPVQTAAPVATVRPTSTALTPIIPITGENVVEMQCQFCVNDRPHVVLILPDFAAFDVDTSATAPVTCLTAEVLNGKRVLVCSGTQLTTFNFKICADPSNCLLFPVALQGCPLTGAGSVTATPMTPVFLTAINTLQPPTATPKSGNPGPSPTSGVGSIPTSTPTGIVPPLSTPTLPALPTPTSVLPLPTSILPPPTSIVPPPTSIIPPPAPTDTVEPTQAPTSEPKDTPEPHPTNDKKDTKTPRASKP